LEKNDRERKSARKFERRSFPLLSVIKKIKCVARNKTRSEPGRRIILSEIKRGKSQFGRAYTACEAISRSAATEI
jgi:hypothetical protein